MDGGGEGNRTLVFQVKSLLQPNFCYTPEFGGSRGTRTLSLQIKSLLRCPVAPWTQDGAAPRNRTEMSGFSDQCLDHIGLSGIEWGGRRESNPALRVSQTRVQNLYTTSTMSGAVGDRTLTAVAVTDLADRCQDPPDRRLQGSGSHPRDEREPEHHEPWTVRCLSLGARGRPVSWNFFQLFTCQRRLRAAKWNRRESNPQLLGANQACSR